MFSRFFFTILAALPMVVLAAPTGPHAEPHVHEHHDHHEYHHSTSQTVAQCNTGTLSCCNEVQAIPGNTTATSGGLIGVPVDLSLLVGLDCDPISLLIGVGGNNCASQPVCCTNNNFPGLVNALECSPVNANL